jgi:ribose transport system substrate-binding protein
VRTSRHGAGQRRLGAALLVATVLGISACAAASGTNSNAGTGAASSGAAAASGAANPAAVAAAAAVAKDEQAPTSMTVTEPLKTPAPSGKTIVYLNADTSSSTEIGDGVQEAAAAVGWHFVRIPFQNENPATLVTGLQQALRMNPADVVVSSLPESQFESVIPAYKAAGVPIIEQFVIQPTFQFPVISVLAASNFWAENAKMIADWFIANSQGKGTVVSLRIDGFPVLKAWSDAFASTVQSGCPDCHVIDVNSTVAQATAQQTVEPVVNALRANPDAHYAVTPSFQFVDGMGSALSAAGLAGTVSVAGAGADASSEAMLKSGGVFKAMTGLSRYYSGWQIMDVALRHAENMPIPTEDGGLPLQLLTQSTPFTVSNSYDEPSDYQQQFKALWHVSS